MATPVRYLYFRMMFVMGMEVLEEMLDGCLEIVTLNKNVMN